MLDVVHAPFVTKKADLIHSCHDYVHLTIVESVYLHKGVYIIYSLPVFTQ